MAKRVFSMKLTDPAERQVIEKFMTKVVEEAERAHNAQLEITKESATIIDALAAKYQVDPKLEMFIDTTYHADHGLIFFASMAHDDGAVPATTGRVLN